MSDPTVEPPEAGVTPRTDAEVVSGDHVSLAHLKDEFVRADFARELERELNEARAEADKARTVCEEIENYAMTANQSVLDDNPEVRKEIFRHIRDLARKGCAKNFGSHTWNENQDLHSQLAAAQKEIEELKRDKERLDWLTSKVGYVTLYWEGSTPRQTIDAAIAQSKSNG